MGLPEGAPEPTLSAEDIELLKAYLAVIREAMSKVQESKGTLPLTFLQDLFSMQIEHAVVAESLRNLKVGRTRIAEAQPEKKWKGKRWNERWGKALNIPEKAHAGEDIGYDLQTAVDFEVKPGQEVLVPTGFIFDLPVHSGHFRVEMKIEQRTGNGKKGLFAAAKTVDAGYRPDPNDPNGLVLCLRNVGNKTLKFKRGERVAQGIFAIKYAPNLAEVPKDQINYDTARGQKRLGDTGK